MFLTIIARRTCDISLGTGKEVEAEKENRVERGIGFKKNDLVVLEITDLTEEAQGVGKCDGLVFFVKGSVMGDVVEAKILKVKKNYAYAKVEKLLEASPYRITPLCPVAGKCGGCQLQHLSYEKEIESPKASFGLPEFRKKKCAGKGRESSGERPSAIGIKPSIRCRTGKNCMLKQSR